MPVFMSRRKKAVLAAVSSQALFGSVSADHAWAQYFWGTAPVDGKVIITIGNCHTPSTKVPSWSDIFNDVVEKWNHVPANQDGTGPTSSSSSVLFKAAECDTADSGVGRIQSFNDDYGATGWLGVAQLWTYKAGGGKQIAKVEAKMNEYYINLPNYNTFSNPTAWQHVTCQEIGHGFPLGHQSETGADLDTCMDYDSTLGNPYPNVHDLEQIDLLYGTDSGSSTGTGGGGNRPLLAADVEDLKFQHDFGQQLSDGSFFKSVGSFNVITHVTAVDGHDHDHTTDHGQMDTMS